MLPLERLRWFARTVYAPRTRIFLNIFGLCIAPVADHAGANGGIQILPYEDEHAVEQSYPHVIVFFSPDAGISSYYLDNSAIRHGSTL